MQIRGIPNRPAQAAGGIFRLTAEDTGTPISEGRLLPASFGANNSAFVLPEKLASHIKPLSLAPVESLETDKSTERQRATQGLKEWKAAFASDKEKALATQRLIQAQRALRQEGRIAYPASSFSNTSTSQTIPNRTSNRRNNSESIWKSQLAKQAGHLVEAGVGTPGGLDVETKPARLNARLAREAVRNAA
ncbi:MAG: hypothetical protein SFU25_08000 [Candidatus Caenarcaniphilales bacterium]|nr:hypothetical protein [Candidatus Caenarcaniphilales bacterium]